MLKCIMYENNFYFFVLILKIILNRSFFGCMFKLFGYNICSFFYYLS